jgi:hypothetical protein
MNRLLRRLPLVVLLLAGLALPRAATATSAPTLMSYQGFLADNSNSPMSGSFPMTFKVFSDSTSATLLWSESYASVSVGNGVFNVILGSVNPLPRIVFSGAKVWLQTSVSGNDVLPRRPIVSVPYALHATFADSAAATTGALTGQIQSNCGGSVSALLLYLPGHAFTCYTGGAGEFEFPQLPPGSYTLHIEGGSAGVQNIAFSITAGATNAMGIVTLGPNTQTDPNNCGACGNLCGSLNDTPSCVAGQCQLACDSGYGDCDANPSNGCETSLNNPSHCGSCSNVCSAAHTSALSCNSGNCGIAGCQSGYLDCDNVYADGCEVNKQTDPNNCGLCGNKCAAGHSCIGGVCN